MTKYYARHSSGQNFGCFLDVWNLEVTSDRLNVGVSGGYHSYAGSWFFTTYASLSYYESSGHDWENGDYYAHDSADITFFSASDFFWRHEGYNRSINLYCYMETTVNGQYGTANANVWVTVPALPPSATTLVINSYTDNQATLSWTNPGGIKQAICIERRSNGGAWGEVQVIWGGATATSWTDTSLAVNNTYEYRFRYYNEKAYGGYSNVVEVVTSPSSPTSIEVVSAGGTNVNVTLVNNSPVATGIVWQWSADKDDESSWSGSTAVSGSPVTSFVANGVVGKAYIRVANTANGVQSGWIVSEQVITIAPPNPPVAKTPAGDVVSTDAESILFSWDLNIIDKTDPTAYEFRYMVGEGSWVTTNKVLSSTANSHTLPMSTFSAGNVVTWQARMWAAATTGGSDEHGASEWSAPDSFTIHTPPHIEITSPNYIIEGVNTVVGMPISVVARITDVEGFNVPYASMVLRDDSGIVYPTDGVPDEAGVGAGGIVEFEIASSDYLPANHSEYTVVVSATSDTTLSNTARAAFTTSFTEPIGGSVTMTNDVNTGYVSLLATFDNTGAATPAEAISVSRVNDDGSITPIIVDGANNAGAVDMYAPINKPYRYAVTTISEEKSIRTVYFTNIIRSSKAYFYFDGDIASAKWNQSHSISYGRPEQEELRFSGRTLPVLVDDKAQSVQYSSSFTLLDRSEVDAFKRLMAHSGSVVYKSTEGDVMHAKVSVGLSRTIDTVSFYQQQLSVNYTQVDGVLL